MNFDLVSFCLGMLIGQILMGIGGIIASWYVIPRIYIRRNPYAP